MLCTFPTTRVHWVGPEREELEASLRKVSMAEEQTRAARSHSDGLTAASCLPEREEFSIYVGFCLK